MATNEPTDLRSQLEQIRLSHGALTPKAVVGVARNPDHPLHDRFEWDDRIAGEKYREDQARTLIRSVKITWIDTESSEMIRAPRYLSVPRGSGFVYEPIESIAEDPVITEVVLRQAEREWRAFYRRYGHIDKVLRLIASDLAEDQAS